MENFIKFKDKRGFTLLEILVVVSIIGILIAAGTVSYTSAQKKSRDSRRQEDMKAIQTAFEQYFSVNNSYPSSEAVAQTLFQGNRVPQDPKNTAPYTYNYIYDTSLPVGETYCVCAQLEGTTGNATSNACNFGSGTFYCVQNLQ